jgi:hypothetical protein
MSKSSITWLFAAAIVAFVAGFVIGLIAIVVALAGGAVTFGGPDVVRVDGVALAGTVVWLSIASLAVAGGSLAALVAWIGALLNTARLDDKTWFLVLLVLGLFSFGWIATIAYVLAGPDSTRPSGAPQRLSGAATTD